MAARNVLVTGMSGLIGQIAVRELGNKYSLTGLGRREFSGTNWHTADIADFAAIRPAFDGQDVVVHLAAKTRGDSRWEELLAPNIIGTYNVFEAARQAGVKRLVYASSGATVMGWEREFPYSALAEGRYAELPATWPMLTHESVPRPGNLYGCTKLWGEAMARHYSDTYGMSMICLRIGAVTRENRPTETRMFPIFCSHRDIAQMIDRSINAPEDLRFGVFFVVSDNKWSYRDISHAREVLGYVPIDSAENHRSD